MIGRLIPALLTIWPSLYRQLAKITGQPIELYRMGAPVMVPPAGTIGTNGALTITGVAVPSPFAGMSLWCYFPAGAVYSGSVAGYFWTALSSGTAGTVYDVVLGDGQSPYVPANPAAVSGTGAAYTIANGYYWPGKIIIPGGLMGARGVARVAVQALMSTNATAKQHQVAFGSTSNPLTFVASNANSYLSRILVNVKNLSASSQVITPISSSMSYGSMGGVALSPSTLAVNTAVDAGIGYSVLINGAAADYCILFDQSVLVTPG